MSQKKYSLMKYTWPIFIELLLQMLVGNIDQIMISMDSQLGVAAVGNANQIMNLLVMLFSTISLAMSILVTQYFGSKQYDKISITYTVSLISNTLFALLIAVVLIVGMDIIYGFMQVPVEVLADAKIYLKIMAFGLPIQALYTTYVTMFRTQGWMKQTMLMSTFVNMLNIVGNACLIFGIGPFPALHVAGVAVSSVFARIIGLVFLAYIFNMKSEIKLCKPSKLNEPLKQFVKILNIGIPSAGESVSYDFSQIVIMKVINSFGTKVINTKVYAGVFATFSWVYGSSISSAAQIIVGFLMGGKQYDETHKEVMKAMWISVITAGLISLGLYLVSDPLFTIFTTDNEILELGRKILFIEIFLEIGRAVNMTLVRCLQATGDIKYPVYLGIIFMWGVATLGSYVFGSVLGLGLVGVWIAMALDECIRAVLLIIRWMKKDWMKRQLV